MTLPASAPTIEPVVYRDISTGAERDTGELELLAAAQSSLPDRAACRLLGKLAAPHPVSLVPAGRGALNVSWIKGSASVTSGHTNRAAVAEKSIKEPTFDLTGATVASCAHKQSRRRSSELRQ
jgi:hypothetical protein